MRRRINHGDDSGAALVLVVIVISVIAISLGAMLSFADTSVRTTVNLRAQATTAYEADGAMQAAINNIRNSTFNGGAGQNCFSGGNTLSVPFGSDSVAVNCAADPAKVLIQCPSLSQCNRPGSAILTLGRIQGEDGINIQQPTGSTFRAHGVVFSNSNINVVNGSLSTNTAVYARGACAGTVQSSPSPSCNYGNTANALGNDPGYTTTTSTAPTHQPLPSCTTPNSVVTFQPGYYDDAVGLTNMMAGNSKCKHSTWWFKPGAYYFDFHNNGSNPLLSSGGDVWTVNDGYLVAGTPIDSTGKIVSTPSVPATIPGACDNPINDAKAVGVQFVFGGDSQFAVKAGQAEICGTYNASTPPVAIYGLTSGSATTTALTGANTLKTTSVVSAGTFSNATTTNLANVDGQLATWTNNQGGSQTGTVTVGGYAPPAAIPAGSILTSAQLRVAHGNTAGSTQDSLSVQLNPAGGTPIPVAVPSYGDNALHTDTVDVSQGGTGSLAQAVYAGTFTGAQLTYSATVKHKGTEQLDAMQLDLTYVAPAFRAESGCTTTGPYTGLGNGSSCALVTSVNNSGNQFYVQGTTYAPNAVLDITLNNATEQIFRFGVIARSLWVKETGSFSYTGVVIEVPDDSPGFLFSVFLSAYICPCANPPTGPALSARVAYVDGDPTNPVSGSRQVSVLSWSAAR
jgi:Tfp pilus assembly protein PilX